MPRFESWSDAFGRILREVQTEHPEWSEQDQYRDYRKRCARWKSDRGIELSARDIEALAEEKNDD